MIPLRQIEEDGLMMILRVMVILAMFAGPALASGSAATWSDAVDLVGSGDYGEAPAITQDRQA